MNNTEKTNSLRTALLTEKVIFIDGLGGCGKTMLAPIISSFNRVELMTYAFEIQYYCALQFLGELDPNGAKTLVQCQADLKLYNTMMSREVNFRPSDLSSALKDVNPSRYLERLFQPGDEVIPERIKQQNPIMNFSVHHMIPFCEPVVAAFEERCFFIDVVRHPLYMIKQQALNFKRLIPTPRDIGIYIKWKEQNIPYYMKGWEDKYVNSKSPIEKAIHYCDNLSRWSNEKLTIIPNHLRIPFEPFVLNPSRFLEQLYQFLDLVPSKYTAAKIQQSNIPRIKVAQGVDLEIYRRCGWKPAEEGLSERDELNVRYEYFCNEIGPEAKEILDRLICEYEEKYWNPDTFKI
ncbi:MAG: hypothetical protein NXH75_02130 [Halobacteriovoraceae bacterium]|nr:hypothetical protein [Halobacteriovoraceae bacterium]